MSCREFRWSWKDVSTRQPPRLISLIESGWNTMTSPCSSPRISTRSRSRFSSGVPTCAESVRQKRGGSYTLSPLTPCPLPFRGSVQLHRRRLAEHYIVRRVERFVERLLVLSLHG